MSHFTFNYIITHEHIGILKQMIVLIHTPFHFKLMTRDTAKSNAIRLFQCHAIDNIQIHQIKYVLNDKNFNILMHWTFISIFSYLTIAMIMLILWTNSKNRAAFFFLSSRIIKYRMKIIRFLKQREYEKKWSSLNIHILNAPFVQSITQNVSLHKCRRSLFA